MAVHEYIALDILKNAGITVPRGGVARTPDEALKIAQSLGKYSMRFFSKIFSFLLIHGFLNEILQQSLNSNVYKFNYRDT